MNAKVTSREVHLIFSSSDIKSENERDKQGRKFDGHSEMVKIEMRMRMMKIEELDFTCQKEQPCLPPPPVAKKIKMYKNF